MTIYFWTILIYLLVLVVVGVIGSRGVASQEDFSVAGRKLSVFVLFGTMLATWVGTGSIFGYAEKVYIVGISAWILPLGALLGIAILSRLAGRARGLKQITVQDLLEARYNAGARIFGVVALVIAYTTIVSYQYRAAGAILSLALPEVSYEKAVPICAALIITYTALAGMVSVAYIGVIQGLTMIVGIAVALPVLYGNAGGIEGITQALDPARLDLLGPVGIVEAVGLLLPPFLLVLGDANLYQRFFSARSEGVARKAVLWTLAGVMFVEFAIILTAWVSSALVPNLEVPGHVIAFAARDHLPVALGAIVLTTITAIIFSTAASFLLSPATAIVRDVVQRFLAPKASQKRLVLLLRLTVVALGSLAYFLSTLSDEFLSVALLAYTVYGAAITPALIASFVWKRATGKGAVASIVAGTVTTLGWELWGYPQVDAVLPAIGISVLALYVVSRMGKPPAPHKVKPFLENPTA